MYLLCLESLCLDSFLNTDSLPGAVIVRAILGPGVTPAEQSEPNSLLLCTLCSHSCKCKVDMICHHSAWHSLCMNTKAHNTVNQAQGEQEQALK